MMATFAAMAQGQSFKCYALAATNVAGSVTNDGFGSPAYSYDNSSPNTIIAQALTGSFSGTPETDIPCAAAISYVANRYVVCTMPNSSPPPATVYIVADTGSEAMETAQFTGSTGSGESIATVAQVSGSSAMYTLPSLASYAETIDSGGTITPSGSGSAKLNAKTFYTWTPTWTSTGDNTYKSSSFSMQTPEASVEISFDPGHAYNADASALFSYSISFQTTIY